MLLLLCIMVMCIVVGNFWPVILPSRWPAKGRRMGWRGLWVWTESCCVSFTYGPGKKRCTTFFFMIKKNKQNKQTITSLNCNPRFHINLLFLYQNPNPGKTFVMCVIAREALASAGTPIKRLHHVVPPIVFKVLSLTSVIHKEASEEGSLRLTSRGPSSHILKARSRSHWTLFISLLVWAQKGKEIFQFVYKTVITLKADRPLLSLKLFLQGITSYHFCQQGFNVSAHSPDTSVFNSYSPLTHYTARPTPIPQVQYQPHLSIRVLVFFFYFLFSWTHFNHVWF
mgnify:CR=1 FL=1